MWPLFLSSTSPHILPNLSFSVCLNLLNPVLNARFLFIWSCFVFYFFFLIVFDVGFCYYCWHYFFWTLSFSAMNSGAQKSCKCFLQLSDEIENAVQNRVMNSQSYRHEEIYVMGGPNFGSHRYFCNIFGSFCRALTESFHGYENYYGPDGMVVYLFLTVMSEYAAFPSNVHDVHTKKSLKDRFCMGMVYEFHKVHAMEILGDEDSMNCVANLLHIYFVFWIEFKSISLTQAIKLREMGNIITITGQCEAKFITSWRAGWSVRQNLKINMTCALSMWSF